MSKLFISYSRDDKAWVYELWRALRDRAHHDAWIDQRLLPAQDWWESILQNIETCECFVYVMSPKCVESIYCTAELNYALALNKPIVPLMLKQSDMPQSLKSRRIQYAVVRDDMSLGDTLFTVERALGDVRVNLLQGKYPTPSPLPERPDEPKPQSQPEQISEVYMLAEEAAAENNISLALKLFQQVKEADPSGWGLAAAERIGEIQYENGRNKEYQTIVQMSAHVTLFRGAKAAWRVYTQKYGVTHDPNNIAALFVEPAVPLPTQPATVGTAYMPSTVPSKPTSLSLMPKPFAWVDIPAGKVTLGGNRGANGGYITKATTFVVAAFSIAKYPITNAQFTKFVEAKGYDTEKWWTIDGWKTRQEEDWAEPRYWRGDKWNKADYPVVGVSWYEAIAFCHWISELANEKITLPTDQQWQYAAQGDTGWAYPYGDEFDKTRCNSNTDGTTSVTQYEGKIKGDSPFGVTDMCGNVWEWCLTQVERNDNQLDGTNGRALRGGSWEYGLTNWLRVDCFSWDDPYIRDDDTGFRIVRS